MNSDEKREDGEILPGEEDASSVTDAGQTEPAADNGTEADGGAAALERQIAELKDQYLRKSADFDNYRKRMAREKQEAIDYANQTLLVDLIQTLDNFERAISAAAASGKTETDFDALCSGVSLIETQLLQQLDTKWGLKRFDSKGAPFDPARHEALMSEASTDVGEPVVGEEFMKGYTLKDRVIRPAKVKVLMPAPAA